MSFVLAYAFAQIVGGLEVLAIMESDTIIRDGNGASSVAVKHVLAKAADLDVFRFGFERIICSSQ